MFNVCPKCGEYAVEKTIDPSGPYAICPYCHHAHPFLQQPLFIVTGASGAGKTSVCLELIAHMSECVVLESDILWEVSALASAENGYRDYRNMWLRVAKNIGQAGRPVVLCGSAVPDQFEVCSERRYFSTLYYLALVCDDALLEERLLLRPQWRGSGSSDVLEQMIQFNQWLKKHATATRPPITLCDSSYQSVRETVDQVAQWIRERL